MRGEGRHGALDARIRKKNIDAAEPFRRQRHHGRVGLRLGDIPRVNGHAVTEARRDAIQRILVQVHEDHLGPFGEEPRRHRFANPPGTAGDDRHLILKLFHTPSFGHVP